MKKGDVVTIIDGSYTQSVIDGKLIHEYLNCGDKQGNQYVVIEIDCKFPVVDSIQASSFSGCPASYNDTVIQDIESGKVVFIEERFLRLVPPKHQIMIDINRNPDWIITGRTIEISDKLYQEIIREITNVKT